MSIKVQGQVVINNDKKGLFDQVNPGAYTTAARDALSPNLGDIIYNSEDEELQVWNGTEWGSAGSGGGSIGNPVDVLTPLDGAGVGGATNYTPTTDLITEASEVLDYGYLTANANMNNVHSLSNTFDDGLAYDATNNRYCYMQGSYASVSDDEGYSWTSQPVESIGPRAMCHNGTNFVVASEQGVRWSSDGLTWNTPTGTRVTTQYNDIAFDPTNGRIVAVGSGAGIYSDDNGQTWSSLQGTSGFLNTTHQSVAYGNGKWAIAPFITNKGAHSTDGINWTQTQSSDGNSLYIYGLEYDEVNSRFMTGYYNNGYSRRGVIVSYNGGTSWDYIDVLHPQRSDNNSSYWNFNSVAVGMGCSIFGNSINGNQFYFMCGNYRTDNSNGNGNFSGKNAGYSSPSYYITILRAWFAGDRFITKTYHPSRGYRMEFHRKGDPLGTTTDWRKVTWLTNSYNAGYIDSLPVRDTKVTFASDKVFDLADLSEVAGETLSSVFPRDYNLYMHDADGSLPNTYTVKFSNNYPLSDDDPVNTSDVLINNTPSVGQRLAFVNPLTVYGPSPDDVVFTSSNAGTSPFNGTEATLAYRTWTLETRASDSDPWTNVVIADDYDPVASQDGATAWAGKPTLAADTQYRVKVEYHSANARSVESEYNYFTTGPS